MAALVSLEEFKQRIGVEHDRRDDFFLSVIDGVSAAVEAYIGRSLWAADYVERYDGNVMRGQGLYDFPHNRGLSAPSSAGNADDGNLF